MAISSKTNFKEETLLKIEEFGYTTDDIDWIGNNWSHMPIDHFWKIADVDYDAGFGCTCVNENLLIVFEDGNWMERHEYDGSERWVLREKIEKPSEEYAPSQIVSGDKNDHH